MATHPEILWAQRSSPSLPEKVSLFILPNLILIHLHLECRFSYCQSPRYRTIYPLL